MAALGKTQDEMTPGEFIERVALSYPDLYEYRIQVLEQIFFIIGNGYEWGKDGKIHRCEEFPPAKKKSVPLTFEHYPDDYGRPFYPLEIFSLIRHVPDNVNYDWGLVAVEAALSGAQYLKHDREQREELADIALKILRMLEEREDNVSIESDSK